MTVELVAATENWWTHNGGSLLIAVAAVFAASLAAYISTRTHREQLAHDRYLRNQDHIRDVIDLAISVSTEAVKVGSLFYTQVKRTEKLRDELSLLEQHDAPKAIQQKASDDLSREEGELRARDRNLYAVLVEVHPMSARLGMRLGTSHPVVSSYEATRIAVEALYREGTTSVDGNRSSAAKNSDETRAANVRAAFKQFREACGEWFAR